MSYGEERLIVRMAGTHIGRVFRHRESPLQMNFSARTFSPVIPVIPENAASTWTTPRLVFRRLCTSTKFPNDSERLFSLAQRRTRQPLTRAKPAISAATARDTFTTIGGRLKAKPGELGNYIIPRMPRSHSAISPIQPQPALTAPRLHRRLHVVSRGVNHFPIGGQNPRLGFEYAYSSGETITPRARTGRSTICFPDEPQNLRLTWIRSCKTSRRSGELSSKPTSR